MIPKKWFRSCKEPLAKYQICKIFEAITLHTVNKSIGLITNGGNKARREAMQVVSTKALAEYSSSPSWCATASEHWSH